jgi:hypothetical protein
MGYTHLTLLTGLIIPHVVTFKRTHTQARLTLLSRVGLCELCELCELCRCRTRKSSYVGDSSDHPLPPQKSSKVGVTSKPEKKNGDIVPTQQYYYFVFHVEYALEIALYCVGTYCSTSTTVLCVSEYRSFIQGSPLEERRQRQAVRKYMCCSITKYFNVHVCVLLLSSDFSPLKTKNLMKRSMIMNERNANIHRV